MQQLTVNIENVKSIDHFELALPLESGIYAIIGNNGTGKSTIINCMAQMIARNNSGTGLTADEGKINSCVKITCDERSATWRFKDGRWQTDEKPQDCLNFEGMYERSLFYGTRFNDSRIVDKKLKQKEILVDELVEADSYVKDQLSFILHGNFDHYRTLKSKFKSRRAYVHGLR